MKRLLAVLLVSSSGQSPACKTAQNYLDPRGPVYAGSHAERRDRRETRCSSSPSTSSTRCTWTGPSSPCGRTRGSMDADLIALQEMDAPGTEALARGPRAQLRLLPGGASSPRRSATWATPSSRRGRSRPPSSSPCRTRAAGSASRGRRWAPWCAWRGRLLRVYSLHLGSPFGASPGQRRDQIDVVLCDARDEPRPGGDRRRLQLEPHRVAARGRGLFLAHPRHGRHHSSVLVRPRVRAGPALRGRDRGSRPRREGRERPSARVGPRPCLGACRPRSR